MKNLILFSLFFASFSVCAESLKTGTNSCLSDEGTIRELKERKIALDKKEQDLKDRETEIQKREVALTEELAKLGQTRKEIGQLKVAADKQREERVSKFVETIEKMSPKAASELLGSVEPDLAVEAMSKLSTPKLAKIMNIMEPKRSAHLTAMMTGGSPEKQTDRMPAGEEASGGGKH